MARPMTDDDAEVCDVWLCNKTIWRGLAVQGLGSIMSVSSWLKTSWRWSWLGHRQEDGSRWLQWRSDGDDDAIDMQSDAGDLHMMPQQWLVWCAWVSSWQLIYEAVEVRCTGEADRLILVLAGSGVVILITTINSADRWVIFAILVIILSFRHRQIICSFISGLEDFNLLVRKSSLSFILRPRFKQSSRERYTVYSNFYLQTLMPTLRCSTSRTLSSLSPTTMRPSS